MTIDVGFDIREIAAKDVLSLRREVSDIWPDASRARIDEILPRHVVRDGFRFLGAFADGRLVGFVYGYRGARGQWWHDRVAAALGAAG
jgi:predicted GNAT superfamily acetyltransferase